MATLLLPALQAPILVELPGLCAMPTAQAFELKAAPERYQKQISLVYQPAAPWGSTNIPLEFSVARGEQMTVGYWMVNDGPEDVSVSIDINPLASATDIIPMSAIEARVLSWRERIYLYEIDPPAGPPDPANPDDSGWLDHNNNGSLDRADFEALYPNQVSWDSGPDDTPAGWAVRLRNREVNNPDIDVALYRDPEPLPLYRAEGVVDEPVVIPANQRRMLWLTITPPDDVDAGSYTGTSQFGDPIELTITDSSSSQVVPIELDLRVPCWDTLDNAEDDARFWDYSYHPGDAIVESAGVYLGDRSLERARIRQLAGNNALFIYVGQENRSIVSDKIRPEFKWILSGLHADLGRYDFDPVNPTEDRRIRTIVLGMVPDTIWADEWGTNDVTPTQEWSDRYKSMFVDFRSEFIDRGLDPSDYEFVVVPVDEPTSKVLYPFPTGTPQVCLGSEGWDADCNGDTQCWYQSKLIFPSATIKRSDYFRAAAQVIEDLPPWPDMAFEVLVNHDTRARTRCDELIDDFEQCGPGAAYSDCVDIWMQAGWMHNLPIQRHPLNDGTNNQHPILVPDQFWLYDFQTPDETDEGAMRQLQAGLLMADYGMSGSAHWAFWAVENDVGDYGQYVDDPNAGPTRHSWVKTQPALWNQDTLFYFNNADPNAPLNTLDNSAPIDVPNGELMLPGRTIFARRQALEYRRLLRQLSEVPAGGGSNKTLTQAAEDDLASLIVDAINPCHAAGNCTQNKTTPDEVSAVLHQWLNEGHDGEGSCVSPPAVLPQTTNPDVISAMNIDPWSQ